MAFRTRSIQDPRDVFEDAVFKDLMIIHFVPDWMISHITESVLELYRGLDRDAFDEEEVEEVERIIWGNIHRNSFISYLKTCFNFIIKESILRGYMRS